MQDLLELLPPYIREACARARVLNELCSGRIPETQELERIRDREGWIDADPGNDNDEPYIWEY